MSMASITTNPLITWEAGLDERKKTGKNSEKVESERNKSKRKRGLRGCVSKYGKAPFPEECGRDPA